MASATYTDVVEKILEILRGMDMNVNHGIRDIYERDFPFNSNPPAGLVISRTKEMDVGGLNNSRDLVYPVQVMRVGHSLNNQGGSRRTAWRDEVWERFHDTRIGVEGELKTQVRHMEIELDAKWATWNLDASVLRIETWVRKKVS